MDIPVLAILVERMRVDESASGRVQRLGALGSDSEGIHWWKEFKWDNSCLSIGREEGEQREKSTGNRQLLTMSPQIGGDGMARSGVG